jgi:hypothetical protein
MEDVVIISSEATSIAQGRSATAPELSVARIRNSDRPGAVGVPVNKPVPEARFRPCGNVPEPTDHVYAGWPPITVNADEYANPAMPTAVGHAGIVKPAATAIVNDRCALVPPASFSCTLKVNRPG